MSTTLGAVKRNVRAHLRDVREMGGNYQFGSSELDRMILSSVQWLGSLAGVPDAWSLSWATLTTGNYTSSVASQTLRLVALRFADTFELIGRESPLQLALLQSSGTTAPPRGRPSSYALTEVSGSIRLNFDRTADQNYVLDALLAELPNETPSAGGAQTLDDLPILFSRLLAESLEYAVAAECVAKVSGSVLEKLGLDRGAAQFWSRKANELMTEERKRAASRVRRPFIDAAVR